MQVKGKVVIITGASSGIGLATAKLLSEKGAKIALVSRSAYKLKKISKQLPNSLAIRADMSQPDEIKKMVEQTEKHYGQVDILINNAGQGYDAPVEKINLDTFHKIFDLDVVGPMVAMQQVIPIMRKGGGGAIINISSGTALMSLPSMGGYSSLKRALVGLSLTAREELQRDNIRVSVVYPYITDTDFEKNTIREEIETTPAAGGGPPTPADSATYAAETILEAIESGRAEIFAHDWMRIQK